jgi:predicted nucleotidyltransferase
MIDLRALVERYNLVAVYVFGSRAPEIAARVRGDIDKESSFVHSDSDVDIGVLPGPGHALSAHDKVCLALTLEDVLDVRRVDLVLMPDADPFLAANIVRGERLYAQDAYKADEYDLYVLRRAGDLAPLERERMALILGEER